MHAETFAYILHQLEYGKKIAAEESLPAGRPADMAARRPEFLPIPAGPAQLGLPCNGAFGWDNEYQAHLVEVPAFSVAQHKVTNGEYLEFVKEGADPPFFWADRGAGWVFRGMFSEYPLPLDAPVYVTHDQASAYARWRGMRLPTEAEYHRAACSAPRSSNLNFRYWDPISVSADDDGTRRPMQLAGNGWEWTSTLVCALPRLHAVSVLPQLFGAVL